MHKWILERIGALLLCAALLVSPAHAADDTLTLTGEIGGIYEVPSGVTKVILSGVTAADFESGIRLPASAEVVLKDGTENVCGIMCRGDLHVTGGGALLGGSGIYAFGDLTLDLTGNVVLEGGQIAAFGGSVTINSGTYRLQSLPEGGGGLIVSSNGDVFLNGGDVKIYNDSVGVTSTDGAISVEDTELEISAASTAMIARTINLPESTQGTVNVQTQENGQVVSAGGMPALHLRIAASGAESGEEMGQAVITDGKADVGSAVSLDARAKDAPVIQPDAAEGERGSSPALWIALGAAAVLGAAAAILYVRKKKKHSK